MQKARGKLNRKVLWEICTTTSSPILHDRDTMWDSTLSTCIQDGEMLAPVHRHHVLKALLTPYKRLLFGG